MNEEEISGYIRQFESLRRDRSNGGAPHKPVLLLAIARMVRQGEIRDNKVVITPELVLAFKDIWSKLVVTAHLPNFALPFFHMRTEPFWRLVCYPGMEVAVTSSGSVKSFKNLRAVIAWAEIDVELFALLNEPLTNAVLTHTLLETYFPETGKQLYAGNTYSIAAELENQVMNEDAVIYRQRIDELQRKLSAEQFEEELYVRSGVFKREIPKLYDYQCAISGQRIESLSGAQMVDACHIVPFAISRDDTITNGISLTPTLHRAFDRGLIWIDQEYCVQIAAGVVERESAFMLGQFSGKRILLPSEERYWPSLVGLGWRNPS